MHRISRIQLLNEISNDSKFNYAKSVSSRNGLDEKCQEFPTDQEIMSIIEKSKIKAINTARKIGLIKKNQNLNNICMCHVPPYDPNSTIRRKNNNESNEISLEEKFEKSIELEMKLLHSKLKNYAHKFEENSIVDATSAYVEFEFEFVVY